MTFCSKTPILELNGGKHYIPYGQSYRTYKALSNYADGHVCQRGGVPTATASWKGENAGFTALECNLLLASKHVPILEMEPSNIIIDELHLLLRIGDILLRNVTLHADSLDQRAAMIQHQLAESHPQTRDSCT